VIKKNFSNKIVDEVDIHANNNSLWPKDHILDNKKAVLTTTSFYFQQQHRRPALHQLETPTIAEQLGAESKLKQQ
jgi:hypothetical protein